MTLEQAKKLIKTCAEQMHVAYRKTVFNEWAIVLLDEAKGLVLAYMGPRREGFRENFANDSKALRQGLLAKDYLNGDFEFARQGIGTGFESFMVLGRGIYLICNNTVQHMDDIAKDPLWLSAQVPFVELSDKFRSDPVVV